MGLHYHSIDTHISVPHTLGAPECSGFVNQTAWHYIFVVYVPIMSVFSTLVNTGIVALFVLNDGRQLLQQSQHVYVLASAVTNVWLIVGSNYISWIAVFLVPCVDVGVVPCFLMNFFNFTGCYQIMFNVGLICFDRWRLVRLGAAYSHSREITRAKWLLCFTSVISIALFVVPEFAAPALTGVWISLDRVASDARCDPFQNQVVEQLGGMNLANIVNVTMIVVQWSIILIFTTLTSWLLYKSTRKRALKIASSNSSIIVVTARTDTGGKDAVSQKNRGTNTNKQFRATLIMFGCVFATLLTNGPIAIVLLMFQFWPDMLSGWWQIQLLICWQASSPALDPFAFAVTLPKLRARARKTKLAQWFFKIFRHKMTNLGGSMSFAGTAVEMTSTTLPVAAKVDLKPISSQTSTVSVIISAPSSAVITHTTRVSAKMVDVIESS